MGERDSTQHSAVQRLMFATKLTATLRVLQTVVQRAKVFRRKTHNFGLRDRTHHARTGTSRRSTIYGRLPEHCHHESSECEMKRYTVTHRYLPYKISFFGKIVLI